MTPRVAYPVALASGVALSFAFPEADIAPLAWIAVAPLLVASVGERARRGFGLGLIFGLGFMGTLLVWISLVGWVAWATLVVTQALFYGAFGALWATFSARVHSPWARAIGAAVLWVGVAEYLRSLVPLGGFTWGQLAQSQHDLLWVLRLARIGGGWAVAFVVVAANALVAEAWPRWRSASRRAATMVGVAAGVIALPVVLPAASTTAGDPVRVAIVQGNVPADFAGTIYEKDVAIARSHRRLTEELATLERVPDLVVWPESSVGQDLTRDPAFASEVQRAARSIDRPMVVGGNIDVDAARYRVVAFEIGPDGAVTDVYRKTHLVPFGEYVPARSLIGDLPILAQVPRDAVPGTEPTIFDVAGGRVAPVLSYEGDFGSLVRGRIAAGGRLLIVATNTSTWGESWASAQHAAFSQVRAAENGVWVAHAAVSGISVLVAPDGSVVGRLPLWTAGTIVDDARFVDEVTLYTRLGDWLPIGCLALAVAFAAVAALGRVRRRG